jgi:arylsulfatase A-like enzyme
MGPLRRNIVLLFGFILFATAPGATVLRAAPDPTKPNIVFILADDLGWKDLGCYGTYSYQTPHIDELAAEGMLFTRFHAYPSCSPTRSGLMTGMDPGRLGITEPMCHLPVVRLQPAPPPKSEPWRKMVQIAPVTRLDTKYSTYAKVLKAAGYATGHFGKWHLGPEPYSALQQGFDVDIPHFPGPGPSGSYLAPWNPEIMKAFNPPPKPGDDLEDRMAQEASKFIDEHKDQPFLLNYWAFSVHTPLNAKEAYVDQYKPLIDANHPQRNPVYAGRVKSLDDAVGTLMDTLKKDGLENNTIVIFSSDNGGLEYWGGGGMSHHEYVDTPGTSNDPLRGGKTEIYEGGVRVPLVVKWPGVVQPGSVTRALGACMDIYPTLIEMAGQTVPTTQPLDGVSLVPVLRGTQASVRNQVYCFMPQYNVNYAPVLQAPCASIIDGDWKLIRFYGDNPDGSNRTELYNLHDNLEETFDLSKACPDIVAQLSRYLDGYIARTQVVMPGRNPAYSPTAFPPPSIAHPSLPIVPPPDAD